MTVSELRKALKGIDGKIPVYIADHDHSEFETNGSLGRVYMRKQNKENRKFLGKEFFIDGKYLVLRVE